MADRGAHFSGELQLGKLERLSNVINCSQDAVCVELSFKRDAQRHALMQLRLVTSMAMQCQRCLEEVSYPVDESFNYLVDTGAQEPESLPEGYDYLQVGDEPLELLTMVEDELLLCLPIVAMHPEGECSFPADYASHQQDGDEAVKTNPFGVLAQLKRDKNP